MFFIILFLILAIISWMNGASVNSTHETRVKRALLAYSFGCLALVVILSMGVFK